MYRFVFRTLYRTRSRAVHACGEGVPSRKCDLSLLPCFRVANGGRPTSLSTSSVSYCESKGGAALPPRDETGGKKDGESAEVEGSVGDGLKTAETASELPPDARGAETDGSPAALTTATSADGKADDGREVTGTTSEPPLETEEDPGGTATQGQVGKERELVQTTPERGETPAGLDTESTARPQVNDAATGGAALPAEEQTAAEPETTASEGQSAVLTEGNQEGEDVAAKNIEGEGEGSENKMAAKNIEGEGEGSENKMVAKNIGEGEASENKMVAKSGKESLLDLLGTMKVDLTTKKKKLIRPPKAQPEAPVKPSPAALESPFTMFQKATAETPGESLSPDLLAAASAAASTLPDQKQAESELLQQLRQHEAEEQRRGEPSALRLLIKDMKVGRTSSSSRQTVRGANQIRFDDDGKGYTQDRGITAEFDSVRRRRGLFSGKRLNIFPDPVAEDAEDDVQTVAGPTLWDIDFANQLVNAINNMPRNGLEEMIQWTQDGRLWQYPVDNEAGLDVERLVPFHEHVFLERHLEHGFPSQGPVRHFMELVVAGLARNAHLSVQQKQEHIAWFRDYFQQKEDVLKEADVCLN